MGASRKGPVLLVAPDQREGSDRMLRKFYIFGVHGGITGIVHQVRAGGGETKGSKPRRFAVERPRPPATSRADEACTLKSAFFIQ